MMGQLNHDQGEFFYSFRLDEAVPDDHPVRAIAAVLDLSWVRLELAPFYPKMGRPSVDPVLMIRMLVVGYVFDPFGASVVPRGASEPCLSLVLWALN
jgi:transposase